LPVNPTFFYGPFAPGFTIPDLNYGALTTDAYIYRLLDPAGSYPSSPNYIDVRDVARAHVAALTSPPESSVGRKRILIASPHDSNFQGVVELIAAKRPELKNRLLTSKPPAFPSYKMPVDLKRVENVLDIKIDSYKKWEETILDTVDSLIELENTWKAKGYNIVIPKA
jgi:nucleoside-diphosphate-sugar epimerase